jgi:hypothetical protein
MNTKKINKEEERKKSFNLNEIISNTKVDENKINLSKKTLNEDKTKNNDSSSIKKIRNNYRRFIYIFMHIFY